MFHGTKPEGQPRTVRTLAESRADPQNFPEDVPYNTQAGAPLSERGASAEYRDEAAQVAGQQLSARDSGPSPLSIMPSSGSQSPGEGPSPFSNFRRK
jgi:hypothetical protein